MGCTDLMLKTQNLGAVFADSTIIGRDFTDLFSDAFGEGFDHFIMVVRIGGFDKFDARIFACAFIRETINTVDQNTREQEVRENNNAFITQFGDMV